MKSQTWNTIAAEDSAGIWDSLWFTVQTEFSHYIENNRVYPPPPTPLERFRGTLGKHFCSVLAVSTGNWLVAWVLCSSVLFLLNPKTRLNNPPLVWLRPHSLPLALRLDDCLYCLQPVRSVHQRALFYWPPGLMSILRSALCTIHRLLQLSSSRISCVRPRKLARIRQKSIRHYGGCNIVFNCFPTIFEDFELFFVINYGNVLTVVSLFSKTRFSDCNKQDRSGSINLMQ